jgi:hypothetical protein
VLEKAEGAVEAVFVVVFVEEGGDEKEVFRAEVEGKEGMRIAVDGEAPGRGIV